MIKSVVREHHFTPDVIDALFFDAQDHRGLEFWYNDIVQVHKEMNDSLKKK